jgi:Ca2+-binding RTX toxin-like protein
MTTLIRSDLEFILAQIQRGEANASRIDTTIGSPTFGLLIGGARLDSLIANPLLPEGVRRVDGTFNNLLVGQENFGAADQPFPRLLQPFLRPGTPVTVDLDGGGPSAVNGATDYVQTSGLVFDTQPRLASNLIVDQSPRNPAAVAAAQLSDPLAAPGPSNSYFIPNVATDTGLSAPYNSWFTLFGQFFDHGLDLVNKGGRGTVVMHLAEDDPLRTLGPDGLALTADDNTIVSAGPGRNDFMMLTRASVVGTDPGPDGIINTFNPVTGLGVVSRDDIRHSVNQTTPFIDQNQTYTSHPSHQVFLREYAFSVDGPDAGTVPDSRAVSTGHLIDGATGGIGNWAEVKAQAATMLGIGLTDANVTNVPLLMTDEYGKFIPGANGFAQVALQVKIVNSTNGADLGNQGAQFWREGVAGGLDLSNLALPAGLPALPAGQQYKTVVVGTGHAFLDDIAHTAAPKFTGPGLLAVLNADGDTTTGNAPPAGQYDNELLNRHFVTGDGRGNENIGLTAVHTIFHAEHNRLVEHVKIQLVADAIASNSVTFLNQWLLTDVAAVPPDVAAIPAGSWDGERLFQAARFGTEMQYQHLVFEEFGRKVQPEINIFAGYSTSLDPAIMAEFAHVVYRFGHSMLTETVDRVNPDGSPNNIGLIEAFLNPAAFDNSALNATSAAAAGLPPLAVNTIGSDGALFDAATIVKGMTRQVGNELDQFVTGALRDNLVGLPLDLAAINMARGRDTGIPSLNAARRMFFENTFLDTYNTNGSMEGAAANSALRPYESWNDFGLNLKYDTLTSHHSLINFIAAYGKHGDILAATGTATEMATRRAVATALVNGTHPDSDAFMNSTGAWASLPNGATITGLDDVDFWLGGLAEKQLVFGGLLGSTFAFVFETQMEALQDGDRLYYLSRTAGLNFLTELEGNSFASLIERNLPGVKHLPGDVFSTPAFTVELANLGTSGPILDDPGTPIVDATEFVRMADGTIRYVGVEHIVMGGTDSILGDRMRGSEGDDTLHGDAGPDRLEGGDGNDILLGGDGDDIITDLNGIDNFKGGNGNDAINAGPGLGDLILGGAGKDFILHGFDPKESFGGRDDDFILGGDAVDTIFGNEGHDWIEGGNQADLLQGDMGDPFQASRVVGNDVIIGGGGNDDYDSESGDDIMVSDGGTERHEGMLGFDWVTYKGDAFGADADMFFTGLLPPTVEALRDRFDLVEGLSGWIHNDILRGTNHTAVELGAVDATSGFNNAINNAGQMALIDGLANGTNPLLALGTTSFNGGNIMLGGGGSDLIEGRGGNDIIDGDRWLNVRISIRDTLGNEIGTADRMGGVITGKAVGSVLAGTAATLTLQAAIFAGTINPGNLHIVREILTGTGGTDTALFSGPRANYTIVTNAGVTTVTDNVGLDGVDTIRNVEQLQFTDQVVTLAVGGVNTPATGAPTISDITPTETQAITVSLAGVTDANGLPAAFTAQWIDAQGDIPGATALTFTPGAGQVNEALSVRVSFTDNAGFAETRTSALTAVVGDFVNAGGGAQTVNGNAGSDLLNGQGGNDTLNGNDGADTLNGGTGNDNINGGNGNDVINGGADGDEIAGGAGVDTMTGAGGADDFNYAAVTDTGVGAGLRDLITDFLAGTDDLDFSAIDSNATLAGNQAFTVIGTAAFTAGGNGQVRVFQDGAHAVVQARIGGTGSDAIVDFEVQLNNVNIAVLSAADLIP